jgi:hypothetical protein
VLAGLAALLTVGLIGAASTAAPSGAAPAATEPSPYADKVGINADAFWLSENDAYNMFRQLTAIGVTHSREDITWQHTEPSRGHFDWSRGDNMFAAASRAGVDILGILDYSAPWASEVVGDTQYPPANNADFANFARRVVERYGPGGTFWASRPSLTPRPLRAVEIWNEPWGFWNWKGGIDPAQYNRLFKASAQAINAANPDVDVLIAGDLLQNRTDGAIVGWIDRVLDADPSIIPLIDAYSIHPYHYGSPMTENADARWDLGKIELIRQITTARNANRPFWITELGYTTAPNASGTVSESTQATYTRQAITRVFAEWPYVKRFYVYSNDRDSGNTTDREGYFGLRRQDGTPKPAWYEVDRLLDDRAVTAPAPTTTTTAPPTTTTTPPPTQPEVQLLPARIAVKVFGRILYYTPG